MSFNVEVIYSIGIRCMSEKILRRLKLRKFSSILGSIDCTNNKDISEFFNTEFKKLFNSKYLLSTKNNSILLKFMDNSKYKTHRTLHSLYDFDIDKNRWLNNDDNRIPKGIISKQSKRNKSDWAFAIEEVLKNYEKKVRLQKNIISNWYLYATFAHHDLSNETDVLHYERGLARLFYIKSTNIPILFFQFDYENIIHDSDYEELIESIKNFGFIEFKILSINLKRNDNNNVTLKYIDKYKILYDINCLDINLDKNSIFLNLIQKILDNHFTLNLISINDFPNNLESPYKINKL